MQAPPQATSQQMRSTQKPLAHSLALAHVWPTGLGPQLPATQTCPSWQSASLAQVVAHAPFVQVKGEQLWTPGARQAPLPSQVPDVLRRPPAHDGGVQIVSGG
jgi:hypothetical protein